MDAIEQPPFSEPTSPRNSSRRLLAYSVHVLTASGAVFGVLALLALLQGNLRYATVYLLITLAIDSVDGSIARRVGVTTHAPGIDGRRMDDIVDFLNFVIVPVVFMVQAGSLPSVFWVIPPVVASAFGFSRRDAKTDDDFFLGWPSYWNVLAFYLWLLDLSPAIGALWVAGLSIAIFIPWKYIYPSKLRNPWLRHGVSWSGVVWAIAVGVAALSPEWSAQVHLVEISLVYPAAYMGLSLWMGGWSRA
ncbi:CDP-diacylglycerol O-phosphatidyltransferase [Myxococcota bacterium]|nr:CDP-diacylglycerol O-phosphatidyltransferase [Myxococcota bacterium]